MLNQVSLNTTNLLLEPLTAKESGFIFELLNTEGWKRFIGNRRINSVNDATEYIDRIIKNPNTTYWVMRLKDGGTPIGIVTFIKRDYLEYHDIGFALLANYAGKGYAYEAAQKVLEHVKNGFTQEFVYATTIPENSSSIKLLIKLGFSFVKEIEVQKEVLHLYQLQLTRNN